MSLMSLISFSTPYVLKSLGSKSFSDEPYVFEFCVEVYPGLVLYGPPFWPDLVVSGKRVSEHRDAKVTTSTV